MSLSCHDLGFRYRGSGGAVLSGVSIRFDRPISAIIGPNGAGKSTLLRLLGGLEDRGQRTGRVAIDGRGIDELPAIERVRRIAYLSQTPRLAAPLTVREAVAIGRVYLRRDDDAVDRALDAVALLDRAEDRFGELSVGQRQLAAYARTLAQFADDPTEDHPRFLLADEPIAALDPKHAVRLAGLLRASAERGIRCVMVVHDLAFAAEVADCVICLGGDGRVAAVGTPDQVLTVDRLRDLFGCEFRVSGGAIRPVYGAERVEAGFRAGDTGGAPGA
jgi:iron complex transport system ATP-binding protein